MINLSFLKVLCWHNCNYNLCYVREMVIHEWHPRLVGDITSLVMYTQIG